MNMLYWYLSFRCPSLSQRGQGMVEYAIVLIFLVMLLTKVMTSGDEGLLYTYKGAYEKISTMIKGL